jgi:DNA topoisomerase-1
VKLIIVESPAKAKALQGFLGREYKALATMGHIRDLPYKKLGVDVEHGFRPTYWFRRGGKKQAKRIEDAARKAEAVYVATDPEREGEAIGWHSGDVSPVEAIKSALRDKGAQRVTFSLVTAFEPQAGRGEPGLADAGDRRAAATARRVPGTAVHRAAAALHRIQPDQGTGEARHRAA